MRGPEAKLRISKIVVLKGRRYNTRLSLKCAPITALISQ